MLTAVTNADRASWALSALEGFVAETRVDDCADAIADLVSNLLHLARAKGIDPGALVQRSLGMMREEALDDDEGNLNGVRRKLDSLLPNQHPPQTTSFISA